MPEAVKLGNSNLGRNRSRLRPAEFSLGPRYAAPRASWGARAV